MCLNFHIIHFPWNHQFFFCHPPFSTFWHRNQHFITSIWWCFIFVSEKSFHENAFRHYRWLPLMLLFLFVALIFLLFFSLLMCFVFFFFFPIVSIRPITLNSQINWTIEKLIFNLFVRDNLYENEHQNHLIRILWKIIYVNIRIFDEPLNSRQ